MRDFQVKRISDHGRPAFQLAGSLDFAARPQLHESIEQIWNEHTCLRLDLSGVCHVDMSGLSWLINAQSHLRQHGGQLDIIATSPTLQQAMALVKPAMRELYNTEKPKRRCRKQTRSKVRA